VAREKEYAFNTDSRDARVEEHSIYEVNRIIQNEIDLQVSKILKDKDLDYETLPTTSYDCIILAKEIVAKKQKHTIK